MIEKISADELYGNSIERLANRPNSASRYGTGGLSADEVKKLYEKIARIAADKINDVIDFINEGELAGSIKTSLPNDQGGTKTLEDVLDDITSGDFANYLALSGKTESTLSSELNILENIKLLVGTDSDEEDPEGSIFSRISYLFATIGNDGDPANWNGSIFARISAIADIYSAMLSAVENTRSATRAANSAAENANELILDLGSVSETAANNAALAYSGAQEAILAAKTATENATAAGNAATNANQKAQIADQAAGRANTAAETAENKATTAEEKANFADEQARAAQTAASDATRAALSAESATTSATTAAAQATAAAASASSASSSATAAANYANGAAGFASEAAISADTAASSANEIYNTVKEAYDNGDFDGHLLMATFEIGVENMHLNMIAPDEYRGIDFQINNNGHMEVVINGNN